MNTFLQNVTRANVLLLSAKPQAFGVVAAYELKGNAQQHAELDAQQPCWQVGVRWKLGPQTMCVRAERLSNRACWCGGCVVVSFSGASRVLLQRSLEWPRGCPITLAARMGAHKEHLQPATPVDHPPLLAGMSMRFNLLRRQPPVIKVYTRQQQQMCPFFLAAQAVWEAYHNFAWQMACARPSMAAIANAAAGTMVALDQELRARADPFGPEPAAIRWVDATDLDPAHVYFAGLFVGHWDCLRATEGTVQATTRMHAAAHVCSFHAQRPVTVTPLSQLTVPLSRVALLEAVRTEAAKLQARSQALCARVGALIPDGAHVLTTSYSSTVLAALTAAKGRLGGVTCCESRPLCEGAALARALAAAGVPGVAVITDAQAAAFVATADLVLLGADSLTEAGAANKVGSKLVALAAREEGVPVYACCDSGKLGLGARMEHLVGLGGGGGGSGAAGAHVLEEQEEKTPEEVTQGWPRQLRVAGTGQVGAEMVAAARGADAEGGGGEQGLAAAAATAAAPATAAAADAPAAEGITVRNVYFEPVPLALLTGVVTEAGVLTAADISAAVEERWRLYLEGFNLSTLHHPPPDQADVAGW